MAEHMDQDNFLTNTSKIPAPSVTLSSKKSLPTSSSSNSQQKNKTIASSTSTKSNRNSQQNIAETAKKLAAQEEEEQEDRILQEQNVNDNCIELNRTGPTDLTENLRKRFQTGKYFTDIGTGEDIIFVNPGTLCHFNETNFSLYETPKELRATSPHLYRQVSRCHRSAYDKSVDQCLIFSGSTGSGKTECLKQAMQFLQGTRPSPVADKAILIQRILSLFGSAASPTNKSRSRIGYLLDLSLDFKGDIIDLSVSSLFLEKAPISNRHHCAGCQSGFQVFYALLYGASLQMLKSLKIQRNSANYAILRRCTDSAPSACDGMTPEKGKAIFSSLKDALSRLEIPLVEQSSIWVLLTVILKLGNLHFQASINLDGTPGCTLHQEYELHEICQILGCDSGALHAVLTSKLVNASTPRHEEPGCRIEYSAEEAQNNLETICGALYSRLINWLMRKLNTSVVQNAVEAHGLKHIGFVDLPGDDDSLKVNHFDQLCCNYAQERMHWFLLSTRLKEQQKLFILEGIEWDPVLVDERSSLVCEQLESCMSLLDQSNIDIAQNSGFFSKLKKSSLGSSGDCQISLDSNHGRFIVRHFWGEVAYSVDNFVQKNLESISTECSRLFFECKTCSLMQQLFPEGSKKLGFTSSQAKKRLSATSQFKLSLNAVISTLEDRQTTHVFCVKGNSLQKSNLFDFEIVKKQIQSLNISDLVKVRKAGFCLSQHYQDAFKRYRMLSEETWPFSHSTARQGLEMILKSQSVSPKAYLFGRSSVFWKSYDTVWYLEHLRDLELHRLARMIQRAFRRYYKLYGIPTLHSAQIVIAAYFRAHVKRKEYLRKRNACILIAAYFKGWKVRKQYQNLNKRIAADKILRFLQNCQKKSYLKRLASSLPSTSPTSTAWRSDIPRNCLAADGYIRILFHRWRCRQYRSKIDQQGYFKMREKLAASLIFRGKKAGYPFTVGHPFRGDYVRLRQNPKWRRISLDTSDEYVVFADMVSKIHRSSGKVSTMLLVVSTAGILILDHRTLTVKHRASVEEIQKISLSPHTDTLAVFHLGKSTALSRKSGDFLVECRHIIELVAKIYLVIQNSTGKPPIVELSSSITLECDQNRLELIFKPPGSVVAEDAIEVEDISSKLTSCFQTSPSVSVRYATTSPTTASNLAVKMASAAVAGTSSGESTGTPSMISCGATGEGTPSKRMKFIRRGNQIEVIF